MAECYIYNNNKNNLMNNNVYCNGNDYTFMQVPPITVTSLSDEKVYMEYENKHVFYWTKEDTAKWIVCTASQNGFDWVPYYEFQIEGEELMNFSKQDFFNKWLTGIEKNDMYLNEAKVMYDLLQKRLNRNEFPDGSPSPQCEAMSVEPVKRGRGRPRKMPQVQERHIKPLFLPEFLRDRLLDRIYCPCYIKWVDYHARTFEICNMNVIAKAWKVCREVKEPEAKDECLQKILDEIKTETPEKLNTQCEHFKRAIRYHYEKKKDKKSAENNIESTNDEKIAKVIITSDHFYQFADDSVINIYTDNPNFTRQDFFAF